jgi:hypothetical protein
MSAEPSDREAGIRISYKHRGPRKRLDRLAACGLTTPPNTSLLMSPRQPNLSVYWGDEWIHEQALTPGEYVIGQEDGAGIRFEAEDLGSQSGIYLSGKPIAGAAMVQASDTIRVGGARLVLGPAPMESAAAPLLGLHLKKRGS